MNGNARQLGYNPGMAWWDFLPATDCRMMAPDHLAYAKWPTCLPNDLFRFHCANVGHSHLQCQSHCGENPPAIFRDGSIFPHE